MNDPYKVLNVSRDATDAEVKKAYLNLARKYHPDNYHDSPLADLAQEKMKEINGAYEQITKERSGKAAGGSYNGAYGSGYGGAYGGYGGAYSGGYAYQQAGSVFQQVRMAINQGDFSRAEGLLNAIDDHNGEWNFLKGTICMRRGWLDEARRYFQTACQMDPGNPEYRRALDYMEGGGQTAYRPGGSVNTQNCAGDDFCTRLCCAYMICNGCGCGGMRFCFI